MTNMLDGLVGGIRKVYANGRQLALHRGLDFVDFTEETAIEGIDAVRLKLGSLFEKPLGSTEPTPGDVLTYDGASWRPAPPTGGVGVVDHDVTINRNAPDQHRYKAIAPSREYVGVLKSATNLADATWLLELYTKPDPEIAITSPIDGEVISGNSVRVDLLLPSTNIIAVTLYTKLDDLDWSLLGIYILKHDSNGDFVTLISDANNVVLIARATDQGKTYTSAPVSFQMNLPT